MGIKYITVEEFNDFKIQVDGWIKELNLLRNDIVKIEKRLTSQYIILRGQQCLLNNLIIEKLVEKNN